MTQQKAARQKSSPASNQLTRQSRGRAERRGAATVEMAVVAPVIFMLVFGSIEFSRMMMVRQATINAAREGCRHACLSTTKSDDQSEKIIRDKLKPVIAQSGETTILRVAISPEFTDGVAQGTKITTSVTVDCADISWLPPVFCGNTQISATATMKRE